MYFDFLKGHYTNMGTAKETGLPTTPVERRKRMSKLYYTQQYHDFILFVESTFPANLNVQTMMVYTNVDLVHKIKTQMFASDTANEKFSMLCNINIMLGQKKINE